MMEDLISIIVPVYNVESYLDACISSLINQTYQNLEILLIDDGSTDSCGQLCDKWGTQDSRIQVVHQENAGLSAARNTGLSMAQGDYIAFVDSDDYVHPRMYELLLCAAKDHNADIVICHEFAFWEPENTVQERVKEPFSTYDIEALNDKEALFSHFWDVHAGCTFWVWNKLYKKSTIGDTQFTTQKNVVEDVCFNADVYANCEQAVWISQRLYYYRQRQGSIMNSHNATMFLTHAGSMEYVKNRIVELGLSKLSKHCVPFYLNQLALSEIRAYIWGATDIQKQIRQKFVEEYRAYHGELSGIKNRAKFMLIRYFLPVYHILKKRSVQKYMQ